jgi:transposase
MDKRNMGWTLCYRTPERRKKEMLVRVLTHDFMPLFDELKD